MVRHKTKQQTHEQDEIKSDKHIKDDKIIHIELLSLNKHLTILLLSFIECESKCVRVWKYMIVCFSISSVGYWVCTLSPVCVSLLDNVLLLIGIFWKAQS